MSGHGRLCGLDLDDVFAFTAPKQVVIRDSRLGLMKLGIMIMIFAYIVAQVLNGNALLELKPDVDASIQWVLENDTKCEGPGCDKLHWPRGFCDQTNFTVTSLVKSEMERCAEWVNTQGEVGLSPELMKAQASGESCGDLHWGSRVLGLSVGDAEGTARRMGSDPESVAVWLPQDGGYRQVTLASVELRKHARAFVAIGEDGSMREALIRLAPHVSEEEPAELLLRDVRRVDDDGSTELTPQPCFRFRSTYIAKPLDEHTVFLSMMARNSVVYTSTEEDIPTQGGGGLAGFDASDFDDDDDDKHQKQHVFPLGTAFTKEPFHGRMVIISFGAPIGETPVKRATIETMDHDSGAVTDERPLKISDPDLHMAPSVRKIRLALPDIALRAALDPEACGSGNVCEVVIDLQFYNSVRFWQFFYGSVGEVALRVRVSRLRTHYAYFREAVPLWPGVFHRKRHCGLKIKLRTSSAIQVFSWMRLILFLGASFGMMAVSIQAVIALAQSRFIFGARSAVYKTYLSETSVDMSHIEAEYAKEHGGDRSKAMHEVARIRLKEQLTVGGRHMLRDESELHEIMGTSPS